MVIKLLYQQKFLANKILLKAIVFLMLIALLNSIQLVSANSEAELKKNLLDSKASNDEVVLAFNNFNQENNFQWKIEWNNKTGTPKTLYKYRSFELTGNKINSNPEDIAKGFLRNHSNFLMLKKDLADLRTTKISYGLSSSHVRFIQTYNNLTVYGAETSVHMNKDGQIELIHNNYQPQININTSNRDLSKDDSISTAIKHLKSIDIVEAGIDAELVVYPKENSHYLAWKLTMNQMIHR